MSNRFETLRPGHWSQTRLREILERIRGRRVLVVGDVGVDRYTQGAVERISPEAPVPIVAVESEWLKLGLAANVAENVVALGGVPLMAGLVGKDRTADDMVQLMSRSAIDSAYLVVDESRRTVLKERIVSERQQLLRVDYESVHPCDPRVEQAVTATIRPAFGNCEAVVVEDYAKGMLTSSLLREIFALARQHGKPALVDPNTRTPLTEYAGAFLLTPNTKEAEALTGMRITDENRLYEAGQRILGETGATHALITRGKDGISIFTAGERRARLIPTAAREVYDVSGAGDTVISMLSLALSAGATIDESAVLANLAAGIVVGKKGTATCTVREIEASFAHFFED